MGRFLGWGRDRRCPERMDGQGESEEQGAGQREGTLKAEAGRDRGPKAENVGAQGLADRHPSTLACLEDEEISSLSHSVVFLYFSALLTEKGFFISLC